MTPLSGSRRPPVWPGWTILTLWTWLLFYLASAPAGLFPRMPLWGIPWDKIVHAIEWALWSGALAVTLTRQFPGLESRRLFLWTVSAAAVGALAHEVYQIHVPGRSCDPVDWLADMIGAILAGAAFAQFGSAVLRWVAFASRTGDSFASSSPFEKLRDNP